MKSNKTKKSPSLINTLFRNALKSNLDLTSLADTKASILISINGFILTVSVTASSFTVHSQMMTYAFISIILTSLGSIILAVLAVKPRRKDALVSKESQTNYTSLLYYQDAASMSPQQYKERMQQLLENKTDSQEHMTLHLHMLAAEIEKKYFWLKRAYTFFSLGLLISAVFILLALTQKQEEVQTQESFKTGSFYNIFEPSGATTVTHNKILLVEDESEAKPIKIVVFDKNHNIVEVGSLHIPKKIKKVFKKSIEDLEGLTFSKDTLYAITSHSPTRANEEKPTRQHLLMMHYEDESITKLHMYDTLKKDLQRAYPKIFQTPLLHKSTLNIEGLTIDNGALVIAFRTPTYNSKAILLTLAKPKKLFKKHNFSNQKKLLTFIDLGGLGIRGIVYDNERKGYWIIAGSTQQRRGSFRLAFYDKYAHSVHFYDRYDIGQAEGITIVNNGTKRFLFLVEDNGEKPNKPATYIAIDMEQL